MKAIPIYLVSHKRTLNPLEISSQLEEAARELLSFEVVEVIFHSRRRADAYIAYASARLGNYDFKVEAY